jgi:predicted small lipoprotein YifL
MRTSLFVTALLAAALVMSACGRKGQLERPASAAVTDSNGQVSKSKSGPDRPFILDGLIR